MSLPEALSTRADLSHLKNRLVARCVHSTSHRVKYEAAAPDEVNLAVSGFGRWRGTAAGDSRLAMTSGTSVMVPPVSNMGELADREPSESCTGVNRYGNFGCRSRSDGTS